MSTYDTEMYLLMGAAFYVHGQPEHMLLEWVIDTGMGRFNPCALLESSSFWHLHTPQITAIKSSHINISFYFFFMNNLNNF